MDNSEKEKMLKGELYSPLEKNLSKDREICKTLCCKYNTLDAYSIIEKEEIIKKLFKSTGVNFTIEPNFWCDYGYNITIGDNFYSNHNLTILDCAEVIFGDNVSIGPNTSFYTAEHPLDASIRNKGLEFAKPIKVGDNVWIGGSSTILSGVTIGDNSVIAAGAVVTKNVPEDCVVAGCPAKIIKRLD